MPLALLKREVPFSASSNMSSATRFSTGEGRRSRVAGLVQGGAPRRGVQERFRRRDGMSLGHPHPFPAR
ncbi:hypothetical protein F2981_26105 (plasmid) [Sinorhizobium meliloti]|nr:hypothetical protein [Sinorhizobium meliloti]